jgi:tetratricopeptide (TPR) repeat protein
LHARIVAVLEALPPERLTEQVDRLAHHAVRGEVWDKALAYCRQAGAKAVERAAFREAEAAFAQALGALEHLPEHPDTCAQAIDLRLDLRSVLAPLAEYEKLFAHLRAAEALAEALGDQRRLGQIAVLMGWSFRVRGDYDHTIAASQRALAIAEGLGDVPLQVSARYMLGHVYHLLGDYHRAIDLLRSNVACLEGELRQAEVSSTGLGRAVPPAVTSRTSLVLCLAEVGAFAEGSARSEEGVAMAEAVAHPVSVIFASRGVGLLALRQGEVHKAIPALERGLTCCQEAHLPFFFLTIAPVLGAAYTLAGRVAAALPLLEQVMEQATATRRQDGQALWVAYLSEATLRAGRPQEALAHAQQALELARTHKERGHEAWTLRLLGDIAMQRDPAACEEAATAYRQALSLAQELGMRPLQAHCHRGFGMLYVQTGQLEQARTELSTAIKMYQSMEMTFWLSQAGAALTQMEGR